MKWDIVNSMILFNQLQNSLMKEQLNNQNHQVNFTSITFIFLKMIDDVQVPKSFEGTFKEYQIYMRITPEGKALEITVQNTNTLEQYELTIDEEYVKRQKDFQNIFEEPIDVLGYFIHYFPTVIVEEQCIKIRYEYGTIRKAIKNFIFPLNKIEKDPLQLAELKIQKMKQTFAAQLAQKEKKIIQLQTQLNSQKSKYQQILLIFSAQNKALKSLLEQPKLQRQKNFVAKGIVESQPRQRCQRGQRPQRGQQQQQFNSRYSRLTKIAQIQPGDQRLEIKAIILSSRSIGNRQILVLGDQTGTVDAFVIPNPVFKVGNTIKFLAAPTVYKEHIQLRIIRVGKIEENIERVNIENDVSRKRWTEQPF